MARVSEEMRWRMVALSEDADWSYDNILEDRSLSFRIRSEGSRRLALWKTDQDQEGHPPWMKKTVKLSRRLLWLIHSPHCLSSKAFSVMRMSTRPNQRSVVVWQLWGIGVTALWSFLALKQLTRLSDCDGVDNIDPSQLLNSGRMLSSGMRAGFVFVGQMDDSGPGVFTARGIRISQQFSGQNDEEEVEDPSWCGLLSAGITSGQWLLWMEPWPARSTETRSWNRLWFLLGFKASGQDSFSKMTTLPLIVAQWQQLSMRNISTSPMPMMVSPVPIFNGPVSAPTWIQLSSCGINLEEQLPGGMFRTEWTWFLRWWRNGIGSHSIVFEASSVRCDPGVTVSSQLKVAPHDTRFCTFL